MITLNEARNSEPRGGGNRGSEPMERTNEDVDRVVAIAASPRVDGPALIARLEKDAGFVLSFLASRGNGYLAAQANSIKASVAIAAVKLDKDAREIAGAIA